MEGTKECQQSMVKYTVVLWIKLMSRDKLKTILLFGAHARGEQAKKWQVAASLEP